MVTEPTYEELTHTHTHTHSKAEETWGLCTEPHELRFNETYWKCDGMIGMVNRSEIDVGLGE